MSESGRFQVPDPGFTCEGGGKLRDTAYLVFVEVNPGVVSKDEPDSKFAAYRFADRHEFNAVLKKMQGREGWIAFTGPLDERVSDIEEYDAVEAIEEIELLTAERRASA